MAIAPPPVVLNVPDLVGYAQQLKAQKEEKQNQLTNYLSKFTKEKGQLLDGVRPEVQKAWDEVQALSTEVEMNDSPSNRAALNRAYQDYAELAGAGMAYTQAVLKETTSAMMEPEKFNLRGMSPKDLYSSVNTEMLDRNAILSRASQPFILDRKFEYKMMDPYQLARDVRKDWDESAKFSYIDPKTGKFDPADREKWIRDTVSSRMLSPEFQKNAAIWSGVNLRQIGEGGQVTDYTQIENIDQNPQYNNWIGKYADEVYKYTDLLVPESSINPYQVRQDQLDRQSASSFGFGFGTAPKGATLHSPFERPVQGEAARIEMGAIGTNIVPPTPSEPATGFQAQDGIYSGSRQIVEFGRLPNGKVYVSYKGEGGSDAANVFGGAQESDMVEATPQDIASVKQYLTRKKDAPTYNFLFGNDVSSSRASGAPKATSAADLRAKYDY
jgi:hypothetical protein